MSAILKVRIPFYRRKTQGGTDGAANLYLKTISVSFVICR